MDIEELPEYIDSLAELKNTYKKKIEVRCGLEIEYLPSFRDYYLNLKKMDGIDLLMIGQHFFEHYEGNYSFSDEDKTNEFIGLCESMVQGIIRIHKTDFVTILSPFQNHCSRVAAALEQYKSDS